MSHELSLEGADEAFNMSQLSVALRRDGVDLDAMTFSPFFQNASTMSTLLVQLDHARVPEVLHPCAVESFNHFRRGGVSTVAR